MKSKLEAGGYGWGHAKKELFEAIMDRFKNEREEFNRFMQNPDILEARLQEGADKARKVATATLDRVRKTLGYSV
jgi:tryptophanyl-tRNA synthetase